MSHSQNIPVTALPADVPREEVATHGPEEAVSAPALTARRMGSPRRGRQTVVPEVQLLLSPAYTPAYTPTYNGACEAGNGTIKHLAHQIACRHNRPEV